MLRKIDPLDKSSDRCPEGEGARGSSSLLFAKIDLLVPEGIANANGDPLSSTITSLLVKRTTVMQR